MQRDMPALSEKRVGRIFLQPADNLKVTVKKHALQRCAGQLNLKIFTSFLRNNELALSTEKLKETRGDIWKVGLKYHGYNNKKRMPLCSPLSTA